MDEPARPLRGRLGSAVFEIATTVILAVAIFVPVTTFGAQTIYVEQHSMIDTLQPGQRMLIDKLTPRFDPYSRGDVVVFHVGGDTSTTPLIKRVIGLEGEKVRISDGAVWIDGTRLVESYTYRDPETGIQEPTQPMTDQHRWNVPDGHLFVLGDHRQGSADSRMDSIGTVPAEHVVGRAVLRYFPLTNLGLLSTPEYGDEPSHVGTMGSVRLVAKEDEDCFSTGEVWHTER